jgi:hypothetical protein
VDSKIESLLEHRPNYDEAKAEIAREIADCEDLKRRVEAFLGIASEFSAKPAKEAAVVGATTSIAEGMSGWWSKNAAHDPVLSRRNGSVRRFTARPFVSQSDAEGDPRRF